MKRKCAFGAIFLLFMIVCSSIVAAAPSDTTPPTVSITSPVSGTIYITAQTVTITASASDNKRVSKVEFYDGATLKGTDTRKPYTYTWTFTSADSGTHNWTAKAYDSAGNSATSMVSLTVNINTDTTPPTGSITINSGAAYTKSTSVTLTLSALDTSGVSQMCISNTTTCTTWVAYATSTAWTLPTGDGTKTVYVWYKDGAGNADTTPYSDSITLDTTAPTNGTLSATAGNAQVSLSWSGISDATSGIESYKLVYSTGAAPASCSSGTQIYSGMATSYTHTGLTNGMAYYYRACAIDNAQNTSTGATASATPVGDTTPPTGSITINSGAAYTNSTSVTLTLSASDTSGVSQMCVSNTTTCSTWEAYATSKAWTLLTGDGAETVYVWYKDGTGNANTTPYSDSIFLDTVPPQCSVIISNGVTYTNSASVTLTLSAIDPNPGSGVAQMCVSNTNTSCSLWVNYATSMNWSLPTGDGTKFVYAWFKDNAGNVTPTPSTTSDSITLDTTAPTNGTLSATAGNAQVSLSWSGISDATSGIGSYKLVYSTGAAPASCSSGTQIYSGMAASYTHTGLTNGTAYYYRVCGIDNAQNTSTGATASATPVSTAPAVTTGSATSVTSNSATLNGTVNPNGASTTAYFQYGTTTSYGSTTASQSMGSGTTAVSIPGGSISGLTCNTTYHYRAVGSNSGGTNYGSDMTFLTSACPVTPPTVTTSYATNIFATSAVLNGTVNPNGSSTTAYFQYGTTTSYGSTTTSQSMGSGTTAVSIPGGSISGLTCGTTYHYRAVGTYSGGTINGADSTFTPVSISVSITSPASGTTYTTAQTVTITASASASCGTISKVEFLDNGTVVATDTATPYAYSWTITAADNGTHSWIARAYDAIGQNTTSLPVSLTVNIGGGQTVWAEHVAGNSYDSGNAVAVDSSGNTVVVGYFQGTADFGGGSVTGGSGKTMFIAKYSVTGAYLWAKSFGSTGGVTANAVAVDSAGNIIVVGSLGPTGSTVNFGGGTLTSLAPTDIVIAKFSSAGTHLWSKIFNTGGYSSALGVAVDSSDNVVMTGSLQGGTNFGGGLMQSGGSTNTFIAKFSSVGTYLWSTIILSYLPNTGYGVAVDSSNNIVVTGSFQGTAYFGGIGGTTLTSVGLGDIYVTKLSPTGNFLWTKTFGTAWDENSYSVAIDSGSNIVITGTYTSAPLDFGGGPLPYNSGTDIFVAKFSLQGLVLWSKGFLASGKSTHVAVDGAGNVVLTGYFMSSVNLGGGLLTSAGNYDAFVAKYAAADGTYLWADRFGGAGNDIGYGVAVDGIGDVVATGFFAQTVNFGGISLTSTGPQDIFFIKLTP